MAFNKAKALKEAEKYTAQNKVAAAIKKYEEILKHDRSDLSLLNTLGDLYVRDKKVPKAIDYFNQLGDFLIADVEVAQGVDEALHSLG